MKFEITAEERLKIKEWEISLKPKIYDVLRGYAKKAHERGDPYALIKVEREISKMEKSGHIYYGAIGGGLTYMFTPTGIGTVIKVKESFTGEEIDITDYNSW